MESDLDVDDPSSHENEQRAGTCFLKITVRLDNGKDFSDILNACKQQLERSLSTVSVISWASQSEYFGSRRVEALCTTVLRTEFDWDV